MRWDSISFIVGIVAGAIVGIITGVIANWIWAVIENFRPNPYGKPKKFRGTRLLLKHNQKAADVLCNLAEWDRFAGKPDRPLDIIIGVNPGGLATAVEMNRRFKKPLGVMNTRRGARKNLEISNAILPNTGTNGQERPEGILVVDAKWKSGNSARAVHERLREIYSQEVNGTEIRIHYAIVLGYEYGSQRWNSINRDSDLLYGDNQTDNVNIYVAYYADVNPEPDDPIHEEVRQILRSR